MPRRNPSFLVFYLALAMVLGCGAKESPAPVESTAPDAVPVRGGTLRIAITRDPGSLGVVNRSGAEANRVFALLQPGPMLRDHHGDFQPGLLESWSWNDDRTQLDARLDATLRWSDGEPFVADDIVATFDLLRDPQVGYVSASYLEPLETVEALAPDRVRFTLRPGGAEPERAILHDILPAHRIAELDRSDPASWPFAREPVTLGPYRLAQWTPNERLVLERNPHHPRPGHLDAIELLVIPDPNNALLRLEIGEVDVIPSIPLVELSRVRDKGEIDVEPVDGRLASMLFLNLRDDILSDPAVREAIDLAVDRRTLAEGPLFGTAKVARGFLPPASWAFDPQRPLPTFDLARAKAVLEEAGWNASTNGPRKKDGRPLHLELTAVATSPDREAVASLLRTQLEAAGFDIDVQTMDVPTGIGMAQQGKTQILYVRLGATDGVDFHPFFVTGAPYNLSGYESAEFDAVSNALRAESDREAARELAARAEDMIDRDRPVLMLLNPQRVLGFAKRVEGETPTDQSYYDHAYEWWVADAGPRP